MIGLLIGVLVVCLVLYCTSLLLGAFKVADPFRTVIFVVVVILCVMWLIGGLGVPTIRF